MQISFFLKTQKKSCAPLFIYGSIPELGAGDINHAIPLDHDDSDAYSWKITVNLSNVNSKNAQWYSYFYKTKFGAIVREVCPKRFISFFGCNCSYYDTFDIPAPIGDLVVRFRVHYMTHYGQEIYVCGDPVEMGSWNPRRAILLNYTGDGYWEGTVKLPLNNKPQVLYYKYIVYTSPRNYFWEGEENHKFEIGAAPSPTIFEINDVFHWNDPTIDAYSTSPFIDVINKRISLNNPVPFLPNTQSDTVLINFIVKCPYVRPFQDLYIIGSTSEIGNWKPENAYKMSDYDFPAWKAAIVFQHASLPFDYKYIIRDKTNNNVIWESRPNRVCPIDLIKCDESFPRSIIINDWFTNPNPDKFKGFGICVPLASLRSAKSVGIGQYTDIIGLVDYCNSISSSLIQLLPINDTTTDGNWNDSNPYKQTSAFALHPIYIDLLAIPNVPKTTTNEILDAKTELDALSSIDYPRVYSFKLLMLHEIYSNIRSDLEDNDSFNSFLAHNSQWLQPYSVFCVLRDLYGTPNFREWPEYQKPSEREIRSLIQIHEDEVQFYYWVQYICHSQFISARKYASSHGVVLEGDIPFGVSALSSDVWAWPNLFNDEMYLGAAPSVDNKNDGENWESPSYNWGMHASTDYSWWRLRLRRLSDLFQAMKLDKILSFYRSWEVPANSCIRGMLGHYDPALSYSRAELRDRGFIDIDRFVKPYVRWNILAEKFGRDAEFVANTFFRPAVVNREDQVFKFKDEYDNEIKVHQFFESNSQYKDLEAGVFELLGNVILVPDPTKPEHFHIRAHMTIERVRKTAAGGIIPIESSSWSELQEPQKSIAKDLFVEYYGRRQTALWLELAAPKLKMLQESTNMLLCGEDLNGSIVSISTSLPGKKPQNEAATTRYFSYSSNALSKNLTSRGLLSLRVQRCPRDPNQTFDKIREFPYFTVAMPSTHDMSTIREWWEQNREATTAFWRDEVWRNDEPPNQCEPWVQELILKQHLSSDAMWAVFLLQDIAGADERFRRQLPSEERINNPLNPNHHWSYRFPYSLEELIDANDFAFRIREYVIASNRF